ncbi:MAG TPA: ABC transporter ATP-binding protein [Thermodesulfobacteriota bacterium]|nr:ABC transporter ATP-binding protein [Thermodesulfobacteriota bacterium]
MTLLEVRSLSVVFGGLIAVKKVDLTIQQGQIVGLIGPNGAGKTTLFNCLSGFQAADEGAIYYQKVPIHDLAPHRIASLGLARTFQTSRIFKRMTVLDHVLLGQHGQQRTGVWGAIARPDWVRREEARSREKGLKILSFFEDRLLPRIDDFAETLSYANRRRLEIARALVSEPKLLLLDEPTAGMNPHESAGVARLITKIRDELGVTVFLIEHDMKVIMGISDRIIVLDHGERIAEGVPEEIRQNSDVVEAYLGRKHGA